MKVVNFFYKTGIDITKDKDMFDFLKQHFTYYTGNSWNGLESIANNVKIHRLNLDGDCWKALAFLEADEYFEVNDMLAYWEENNPGYSAGFNGRSGGYLVLYNKDNFRSVLPEFITGCYDYEDYKNYCKEYYGSVSANRADLIEIVKIVQSFDKLCDEIRSYVNELSLKSFEKEKIEEAVDIFNFRYKDDLEFCKFQQLTVNEKGEVDTTEISKVRALLETFIRVVDTLIADTSYTIKLNMDNLLSIVEK